jgi:hypothetical protein
MKKYSIYLLLLIILLLSTSCRRNRLKISEKSLANEILIQEQENEGNDRAAREKQLAEGSGNSNGGIRYKEDRSVDNSHPPIVIDISRNLDNVREIRLSDVASEINYIRMERPPDSAFKRDVGFKYHLTNDYIIAINGFGILHFSRKGKYVNTIVKNELTGMEIYPNGIMGMKGSTLIGAENPIVNFMVKSSGNKLYYIYCNDITGQEYLMEYDCSETQIGQTIKYDPENPLKVIGQGQIIVDLNNGSVDTMLLQRNQYGIWSRSPEYVHKGLGMYWIDNNNYTKKLKGNNMMGIFNKYGDTLATFTQHEKLINYAKSIQRSTDWGSQYEFGKKLFFRNPFNDTIFQIIPPNRLLPVYVLNFGSYKVTRQQGVDPGFDLTGKILLNNWAETTNFIFLTFTKDNYDCIANRRNKKVKIYHALYSKPDNQISILKGDPFNYSPEILENDIDGGIPVWPSFNEIGNNGEIMLSIKGKQLKERIRLAQFINSNASEFRRNELKQLAASVSDNEDILMLIK